MAARDEIALIDDDAELLDALSFQLDAAGYHVHSFGSAAEFLVAVSGLSLACIVCDYHMPGLNGMDVLRALAARPVQTPFIMLTAQGSVPLAVSAMREGSVNFLEKGQPASELIAAIAQAIATAVKGKEQVLAHRIRLQTLTPREREVLALVADGLSAKQIAQQLGTSYRTVETHRLNLGKKLDIHSPAQLNELLHLAGER
ncbi:response regulator transcription factor [Chitiniphilus eburneus]|uniref:Response regulator transcription factor n=1 Tax=Chitiniphilus eburneus TaxID=2571148 RepID=A0A4U0PZT5_9NEIS|nr:response regulator [Chitiniphilus eburneus]TJZ73202.1 response regulator transcription factor [Chitiniphilus eburneus]